MKVHRDVKFKDVHVRVPAEIAEGFKAVCKNHKTTTCHVLYTLMKATIKGDKSGMIDLAAKNPLIINMMSFFSAKPRGHGKYVFAAFAADGLSEVTRCPHLIHKDWNFGRLGWCNECHRWVTPEVCLGCMVKK